MPSFYDYLKSVYTKQKIDTTEIDLPLCIALTRWLSFDTDTIYYLKYIVPFLFYVEPIHYYYLLYGIIPYRRKAPYIKKIDKVKDEKVESVLLEIQKYFCWSDKELKLNEPFLLKDKKLWKKELAVK